MAKPGERIVLMDPEVLLVFGSIIHGFARIEGLMIATTAAVANTDLVFVNVLMRGLGYEQKRDALYSYFILYQTKDAIQKPIRGFLNAVHEYQGLRNHIAHSLWARGTRPASIKPASLKVRGGKATVYGVNDEEKDYTIEDLANIADKLRMIHNSLLVFLTDSRLLSNIDENMLQSMEEISAS